MLGRSSKLNSAFHTHARIQHWQCAVYKQRRLVGIWSSLHVSIQVSYLQRYRACIGGHFRLQQQQCRPNAAHSLTFYATCIHSCDWQGP